MLYTIATIAPVSTALRQEGKTLVLATGFFDLLHEEHLNFLKKAKAAGDVLIVAVESDARARKLKGEGRPVETQTVRCEKLSPYADYVIALSDDFDNQAAYESLIIAVQPAIYAISSHSEHQGSKQVLTERHGGKLLVVHDFNPAVSTTKILEKHILTSE